MKSPLDMYVRGTGRSEENKQTGPDILFKRSLRQCRLNIHYQAVNKPVHFLFVANLWKEAHTTLGFKWWGKTSMYINEFT